MLPFHSQLDLVLRHEPVGLLMPMLKGYRGKGLHGLPRSTTAIVFSLSLFYVNLMIWRRLARLDAALSQYHLLEITFCVY